MSGLQRYSAGEAREPATKRVHMYNNLEDVLKIGSAFMAIPATILFGCLAGNLMTGLAIGKKLDAYLKLRRKYYMKPWPEKNAQKYLFAERNSAMKVPAHGSAAVKRSAE